MTAYLGRRVLQAVAVVLLVTLILFCLIRLAPDDALASVLGGSAVHQQFLLQYLTWLGRALHGNLGVAASGNEPVTTLLAVSLPRTLALTVTSTLISLLVAIPVGLAQAVRRNTVTDHALRLLTFVGYGMPSFVLGSVLILFFAVGLHMFGAEGPQAPGFLGMITDVRDMALPVLTLTATTTAVFARYMRSAALDSLAQDYVEAARARGAGQQRVLAGHVLRNSLVPVVTLIGLSLPQIVGGSVLVEYLFNIRGIGYQLVEATLNHDFPVTVGFTLVIALAAAAGSLAADVCYAALDPRVRTARA